MMKLLLASKQAPGLRSIIGESFFGYPSYHTAALPDRLYVGTDGAARPPSFLPLEPDVHVRHLSTPLQRLISGEADDTWAADTRRSLARLEALWLLVEDRHRLLDSHIVEPLAHQASLVEHVLASSELRRVLIADEVGLGKTIEVGLIIKRLQESDSSFRALYLTEARLVDNVREEFERLGLKPRRWCVGAQEARLTPGDSDPLVIASIHRAVGTNHFETVAASGPWNLIVVDEAHHLSDWSPDGTDPQQRMRLVKQLVEERLPKDGRLILLTGTPHQGHVERFRNLLRLLDEDLADDQAARGRVIYRIKDDIRDWEGRPLFPLRRVEPPIVIGVGADYRQWMNDVHALLTPTAGTRAGAWRRAQAMQWCASSPQAGLAYLVRLALRLGRSGRTMPALLEALKQVRPYRGGPEDEPLDVLENRSLRGAQVEIEADEDDVLSDASDLASVLKAGAALVQTDAIAPKLDAVVHWLDEAPLEKVVVFAQPVETVFMLRDRLEARLGKGSAVIIVGGQSPEVRKDQIQRFKDTDTARVLVSSRSGGEGINLQVSRRLVHFDVPWNPMDMEQRVGRVHRYGSLQTILVRTLVLSDSREQRVLARCRARLGQIVRDVDAERLELLFSRTMALVPMEELEQLMATEAFGPLTPAETDRLDRLVQQGYDSWLETDAAFRDKSSALRTLERGPVDDADLEEVLLGRLGAKVVDGWMCRTFVEEDGDPEPHLREEEARVLQLPDGSTGYVGGRDLLGLVGPTPGSASPRRFGLNDPSVAPALRGLVGGAEPKGKGEDAWVHGAGSALVQQCELADWVEKSGLPQTLGKELLLHCCLVRYLAPGTLAPELSSELVWHCLGRGGESHAVPNDRAASLVRLLRNPRPKRSAPAGLSQEALLRAVGEVVEALRKSEPGKAVPAVFPVAAVWLEAD